MNRKIITTLGPGGWEVYGKRFVESFQAFWPKDITLEIYCHDHGGKLPSYPGVVFKELDHTQTFKKLKGVLGQQANNGPMLEYSFKAVALTQAVTPDLDWIGFVDADTETMQPVDNRLLDDLFDNEYDLTYLYRKSVRESEGSWFAFNLRTVAGASLLTDYWGLYDSLDFMNYIKKHDNAILDRLVVVHKAHGLRVKNLAEGALGLDAFHQSTLGAFMIHYKGPNKDTIADPAMHVPGRYHQVCDVLKHAIKETGRADIVEVGTWNGSRAIHMAQTAFAEGVKEVSYTGFDTFEEGNDRATESHSKPNAFEWKVARRLENYARLMNRTGRRFNYRLIQGNTLSTLPASKRELADATFVYLDGGHSYETVKSDYECVKHVPYIVLDDVVAPHENAPEGPRRVWEEALGNKQVFGSQDGYANTPHTIALGIITKEGFKPPQLQQQIVVKPIDSVDKSEQFEHIAANTKAIKKWLSPYQAHAQTALMVSAGPTLAGYLDEIKAKQKAGAIIFTVKHAYPTLKAAGITPDFTVVLDPRPVDGVSTHGVKRTDLFEQAAAGDRFLVATMTHPSVRELLEVKGTDIYGWHAHTQGTQSANLPEFQVGMVVGGGTCAATRIPMLAFIMGFRRFEFYGYDFFYPADTDPTKIKQQLMKINIGGANREFLTTGELIAAMQDLGVWVKWMAENRLNVTFHGEGAGGVIWNTTIQNYHPPTEYPF